MSKKRPVNLDLTTIDFPVTAIASILHRISGVIIFIALPFIICFFQCSLHSPEKFHEVQHWLMHPLIKFATFGLILVVIYHTLAGLRHIIMDLGFGESFATGQKTAYVVFLLTIVFSFVMGVYLW